ncbi:MAG: DUF2807 domain-containing protein [Bacteroidetes bacterium]|nr:DUF2807 domain-containing protein [Bacteroidota bacterium]
MKYYRLTILLLSAMATLGFTSCINCVEPIGEILTENRSIDNFTKLEVGIPANIKIVTSDSAKITISSYESFLSEITSTVKRGKLRLTGNLCNINKNEINIAITVPGLSSIDINGSARVFSETPVKTDKLSLNINGSGQITLNVFANDIVNTISGTGIIIVNGTTQNLNVKINGSGEFKGLGLNTYKAQVTIKGSGNASVVALNRLVAKVDGSGEIIYTGEPEIKTKISGSGKVTKITNY